MPEGGKKNRGIGRQLRSVSFINYWAQRRDLKGLRRHVHRLGEKITRLGDKAEQGIKSKYQRAKSALLRKVEHGCTVGKLAPRRP